VPLGGGAGRERSRIRKVADFVAKWSWIAPAVGRGSHSEAWAHNHLKQVVFGRADAQCQRTQPEAKPGHAGEMVDLAGHAGAHKGAQQQQMKQDSFIESQCHNTWHQFSVTQ